MYRREAVKSLALLTGAVWVIPGISILNGCGKHSHAIKNLAECENTMAEIVEVLIPASADGIPGARQLGIHRFILTMVADCFPGKQASLIKGTNELNNQAFNQYHNDFTACTPKEKYALLNALDMKTIKKEHAFKFLPFIKDLTIQGYMNSEYVMTKILHYELVPARFIGCARLNKLHS